MVLVGLNQSTVAMTNPTMLPTITTSSCVLDKGIGWGCRAMALGY